MSIPKKMQECAALYGCTLMNMKITLTSGATEIALDTISDRNFQYLYLRLCNKDDLAEALRAGAITVEQSQAVLDGTLAWPLEQEFTGN